MNNVTLIGRLGKDPELSTTATGTARVTFSIAVDRISKDKEKTVDWIPITAWDKQATLCDKYLVKGSKVGIVGRIQSRTFDDRNNYRRTVVEVVATSVEFLDPKGTRPETSDIPNAPQLPTMTADKPTTYEERVTEDIEAGYINSDDLPF